MSHELDLLADDLFAAAVPFLPAESPASILGVELDRRPSIALLVPVDGGAPRAVARFTAGRDHADLVRAAEVLATAWANTLPEPMRIACGYAIERRGAHFRLYVDRDSGELALALADGKTIVELAHRQVIASPSALH